MFLRFELVPVADQQDYFQSHHLKTLTTAPTDDEKRGFVTHLSNQIMNLGPSASICTYLQSLTKQERHTRLQAALQPVADTFYAHPSTNQWGSSQYRFALTSPDRQNTTRFQIGRGAPVADPTDIHTVQEVRCRRVP